MEHSVEQFLSIMREMRQARELNTPLPNTRRAEVRNIIATTVRLWKGVDQDGLKSQAVLIADLFVRKCAWSQVYSLFDVIWLLSDMSDYYVNVADRTGEEQYDRIYEVLCSILIELIGDDE